jgi:phosphoribosylaminoimidazolecarboxamide formyltransferase/IMP cyclohydrolase
MAADRDMTVPGSRDQAPQAPAPAAGGGASPEEAESGGAGLQRAAPGEVRVRRALLSVSDKRGIVELARGLQELGIEIVSTGGTARALADAGVEARTIEDFTGFPELMDGRVKTLHPRLYAGLLARRDDDAHLEAAAAQGIEPVDLVCVNLYPFEQTVARADASEEEAIEQIDIGGPTMIRAAAKNHAFAVPVVDPADYEAVLDELRESRSGERAAGEPPLILSLATRRRLAAKAFACTAHYDAVIATWFVPRTHEGFPPTWTDSYEKVMDLRYGENPHQRAAFYARAGVPTHLLDGVRQLHGKELSFNNLLDLHSARELVEDLAAAPAGEDSTSDLAGVESAPGPTGGNSMPGRGAVCAIVKHNNPCGCAVAASALQAYERALACDPLSAYGGVIALDRRVDRACAQRLAEQFVEVLLAPGFDEGALELLREKKNVRLLELARWPPPTEPGDTRSTEAGRHSPSARIPGSASIPEPASEVEGKPVLGGELVQTHDVVSETRKQMRVPSANAPTEEQWQDLLFAWRVCRHVRSNAIVIAAGGATIGIGAGQMSRVDAVRIAIEKARAAQPQLLRGAVLASDAFFPFADGPELAIEAGIGAIIQPGGSVRDEEVIAAVDRAGVAMVATGVRHFRH